MPLSRSAFIKPDVPFRPEFSGRNSAPMFRKRFTVSGIGTRATLSVCGLGIAYPYLNGKPISGDLFTAPVGNYNKTLWYVTYDVTSLLRRGDNQLAVICGNGWYNEDIPSSWHWDEADWRDLPKLALQLDMDGKTIVLSDASWKCKPESAVLFNALRSGEIFDARLWDSAWTELNYPDADWQNAVADDCPPKGILRECHCPPIREHEVYHARPIRRLASDRFVFDIGQNISGYIRLTAIGKAGQRLTIRYAERLTDTGERDLCHMDRFYPKSPIQTDVFICSGKQTTWSPKFTYHGFRYIEIEGIHDPDEVTVCGVFVHQAVEPLTQFRCSENSLNRLFRAGRISTLSNLFYLLSDCPTREKMGWTNDAQSSAEQILTDFDTVAFFRKWLTDIYDAQREDGALPGTIPTPGWGYDWGNGPVSDGVLFELPYRIYLHTGDPTDLLRARPCFVRYLDFLRTQEDPDGWISEFGLPDWTAPTVRTVTPRAFINEVLRCRFYRITALAAELSGEDATEYRRLAEGSAEKLRKRFLGADGSCSVDAQTAVALLISEKICPPTPQLTAQLARLTEETDFHHTCGMVGMRHLFDALELCGLQESAYRILTSDGYPSYRNWLDHGATTLWEKWIPDCSQGSNSANHHMYSCFMKWMIQSLVGIRLLAMQNGVQTVRIAPYCPDELSFAEGSYRVPDGGTVRVRWERVSRGNITLRISVSGNIQVLYGDKILADGIHCFSESRKAPR